MDGERMIKDFDEPLISLSEFSSKIEVYPFYFHSGIPGALQDCYLRAGAARKLLMATELLPAGWSLIVLDGWRPYEVQLAIYEKTKEDLTKQFPDLEEKQVLKHLAKYVAYPTSDVDQPSPHLTGGAIDLTLKNQQGWLDMGTDFDDFSDLARTNWFESLSNPSKREVEIMENRRFLLQIMSQVGFINYEHEWWHFDYGNPPWAKSTKQTAIYKGITSGFR